MNYVTRAGAGVLCSRLSYNAVKNGVDSSSVSESNMGLNLHLGLLLNEHFACTGEWAGPTEPDPKLNESPVRAVLMTTTEGGNCPSNSSVGRV